MLAYKLGFWIWGLNKINKSAVKKNKSTQCKSTLSYVIYCIWIADCSSDVLFFCYSLFITGKLPSFIQVNFFKTVIKNAISPICRWSQHILHFWKVFNLCNALHWIAEASREFYTTDLNLFTGKSHCVFLMHTNLHTQVGQRLVELNKQRIKCNEICPRRSQFLQ